jgi:hypothetical protein
MTTPNVIVVDGVNYIRQNPIPDTVSTWSMHDAHYFVELKGSSVDELIEQWRGLEVGHSLCPVRLKVGDKQIRKVGKMVHAIYDSSPADAKALQDEDLRAWREALLDDADVVRLLKERENE